MSKPSYRQLKSLGDKLPDQIYPIQNKDKDELDNKWHKDSKRLQFPYGMKALVAGFPGSGKSTWVKNILSRKKYKKVYVVCGSKETKEWDDVAPEDCRFTESIPAADLITEHKYTALIFDDVDISSFDRENREYFDKIFKHFSSHFGIDCFITGQNFSNIGSLTARRCCNVFVIYMSPDLHAIKNTIFSKVGIPHKNIDKLFSLLKDLHDHILIDLMPRCPFSRIRYNSIKDIVFKDKSEKDNGLLVSEKKKKGYKKVGLKDKKK